MLPLNQAVTRKTKGSRKLQDPFADREMPNPLPYFTHGIP